MQELKEQRRRLAAWLSDWELDLALTTETDHGVRWEQTVGAIAFECGEKKLAKRQITAGDLYLLHPNACLSDSRMWHLVVVRECDAGGAALVAPFSRFSHPALPGELRVSVPDPGLQVIQVWNARRTSPALFDGAWSLGQLGMPDTAALRAVAAYIETGQPLPYTFACRVGPHLLHPADPRFRYREEEMQALNRVAGEDDAALQLRQLMGADIVVQMAAETPGRYGLACRFRVGGSALHLCLTRSAVHTFRATVRYQDGRSSRRLDGGYLIGGDYFRSLPIWSGFTSLPEYVVDAGITLHDLDDHEIPLHPM